MRLPCLLCRGFLPAFHAYPPGLPPLQPLISTSFLISPYLSFFLTPCQFWLKALWQDQKLKWKTINREREEKTSTLACGSPCSHLKSNTDWWWVNARCHLCRNPVTYIISIITLVTPQPYPSQRKIQISRNLLFLTHIELITFHTWF